MEQVRRGMPERERMAEPEKVIADLGWSDWKRVASRAVRRMKKHDVTLTSAAAAFYATLALIPGFTALVIGYLLLIDGERLSSWLGSSNTVVPEQVRTLLREQVDQILSAPGAALWVVFLLALGFALFSARNGMAVMIHGLNRALDVDEDHSSSGGFMRTFLFGIGAALFVLSVLVLVLGGQAIIAALDLSEPLQTVAEAGRWILLLLIVLFGISVLYRYGPDGGNRHWHFATVGSIIATFIWVVSSLIFAWYVQTVGTYDQVYGALGSIVILMIWLFLSAWAILAGAEVRIKN